MLYQRKNTKDSKEIKIERLNDHLRPAYFEEVRVKEMGNITEVRWIRHDTGGIIQKIDKDRYKNLMTGEIKEYKHTTKRTDNIKNVAQSLKRLRDIINTNVTDVGKCLWATLTYEENMTDNKRLYEDYRKFNMRFQRYLIRNDLPKCEYIVCAEPQQRGAWHLHIIYIFEKKRPYIPKEDFEKIWGLGFVNIKSLKGIDNLGMYLSAYLSNMQLDSKEGENNSNNKRIVKGSRMHLYPKGFRIYRVSKGIKRPIVYKTTEKKAMERLKNAVLIHEKTIEISNDDFSFTNYINYRTFNFNKKAKKYKERVEYYEQKEDKQ